MKGIECFTEKRKFFVLPQIWFERWGERGFRGTVAFLKYTSLIHVSLTKRFFFKVTEVNTSNRPLSIY